MRTIITRILILIYAVVFFIGYILIFGDNGNINVCVDQYGTTTCSQMAAPTYAVVQAPQGWYDLCDRQPEMCKKQAKTINHIQTKDILEAVNSMVNDEMTPESDQEHYGFPDYWAIPKDNKGDCEDYVLRKRQILMNNGWPESDLLITEVYADWFPKGEGHAVLTVLTQNNGDIVLDNLTPNILPWSKTGYKYIRRQSEKDPNIWVSMEYVQNQ